MENIDWEQGRRSRKEIGALYNQTPTKTFGEIDGNRAAT